MPDGTVVKAPPSEEEEISRNGKSVIERLQRGDLPQMVDWFDPGLLAKVGVRSVISATLGQYTDQRLIQAATDYAEESELVARYDLSGTSAQVTTAAAALTPDAGGAVWIDYIADLGDGFEPTYAMAYLLAAEELKVRGEASPLPAGQLLIMGGDQVYPDATKQEYHNRLRDPYDWAFTTPEPKRKLFAIPGNHDWYDGLSAFSALFCSARDRISQGRGTQIGGWQCQQHRSYFAIKLPHNWWLWGPDIQLADNLDDSQRDYFDLMAEQTSEKDNIILCLAEPSWLHKNYDNMHEISMLARKRGAKICAVIAGDWHHYSRYTSDKLGIHFITAGGGGAFAHATHGLKKRIALNWARPTGTFGQVSSPADSAEFNRRERSVIGPGGRDFTQQPVASGANPSSSSPSGAAVDPPKSAGIPPPPKPITDLESGPGGPGRRAKAVRKEQIASTTYDCDAQSIYPPQRTSRLLCLKNLALPFRNRPFTVLVALVYFVYAWAFAAADPRRSPITQNLVAGISSELTAAQKEVDAAAREHLALDKQFKSLPVVAGSTPNAAEAMATDTAARRLKAAEATLEEKKAVVAAKEKQRDAMLGENTVKMRDALGGRLTAIFKDPSLGVGAKLLSAAGATIATSLGFILDFDALIAAGEQSPMFAFLLIGLWAGLVFYVESESILVKALIGSMHAAAHIVTLLFVSWLALATGLPATLLGKTMTIGADIPRILWTVLVYLYVGGLLGGFVMGIYWTLTSTLFNMHTGDAFGALGIKDYKNFLRIKLEPDRATIYAVALDKVPGRKGWRWELKPGEMRPAHNPHIMPVEPLQPRLIEPPIRIDAAKVVP